MKRKSLFNRIISLSIIATLYLTMSASAYAELDTEVPAAEQVVSEEGNETTVTEETAQEQNETKEADAVLLDTQVDIPDEEIPKQNDGVEPTDESSEKSKTIVDKVVDAIDSILPGNEADEDAKDKEITSDEEKPEESDEVLEEEKAKENQPGDTYFEIVTKEDGTQVKATYEYILDEETGELKAILKEEQEGKFDEEGNLIEEEKKECEHELTYISNKDGAHKVKCNKCDLDEYTETCSYDENGVCKYCGYKRLPDPILVYEDDEIIVRVSGAVPANADLKVTPIKSDSEETKEAFEQVEKRLVDETDIEEHDSYGFLAYDISFISQETNEEIEPNGDVTVNLEYKSAVVPVNDVDISQVEAVETSVVHFNEQTEQVEDLTELNRAELGMTESNAISNATFTSSSFSTYVITWVAVSKEITVTLKVKNIEKKTGANIPDNTSIPLTIQGNTGEIKFDKSDVNFAGTMSALNDYSLLEVRYDGDVVTNAKYTTSKSGNKNYYRVTFYNGNEEVAHEEVERKNSASGKTMELEVVAYYKKNSNLAVSKVATGIYRADKVTDYCFTLLDANGNPVAREGYSIGEDSSFMTDDEGKFTLKSGQKADFEALPDGIYTIKETGLSNANILTLSLKDFITKVYVGEVKEENKQAEYDTSASNRALSVNVSAATKPQVVFKNLYTNTTTQMQNEEVSKFIKYNGFDENGVETYRVNFKFDGPKETITTTVFDEDVEENITDTKVNIVILFDKSYSMTTGRRLDKAVDAVNIMVNSFKAKEHVDAMWSVVDFNEKATIRTNGGWVGTAEVLNYVDKQNARGTNYDAALHSGAYLTANLPEDRKDATTIVLFMTDGQPTARGGYDTEHPLVNRSRLTQLMIDAAVASAKDIKCDAFFGIGVGLTTYPLYNEAGTYTIGDPVKGRDILETVVNTVKDKNNLNENTAKINTVEDDDLGKLFTDIAGQIETILHPDNDTDVTYNYAKNVHMQDKLSDNVKAKEGSEYYISVQTSVIGDDGLPRMTDLQNLGKGKWEGLSGYIGGKTASYEIYEGDETYTLTAEYYPSAKTFELKFPDGYVLDKGYSYTVSFEVTPTDDTYSAYYENNTYPDTGDIGTDNLVDGEDTGTSAEKQGFYSNNHDGSYVEFDLGSKKPKDYFPMPVVQVHYLYDWEIIKTDDTGNHRLSNAAFTLVEDTEDGAEKREYAGATSADEGDKLGVLIWTLGEKEKIAVNKEYILTEVASPSGYIKSDENWKIKLDNENKPTVTITKEGEDEKDYSEVYGEVIPEVNGRYITYRYYFKNFPMDDSYYLPETGGRGTSTTTGIGVVLLLASAFLFYRNKKRTKTFYHYN